MDASQYGISGELYLCTVQTPSSDRYLALSCWSSLDSNQVASATFILGTTNTDLRALQCPLSEISSRITICLRPQLDTTQALHDLLRKYQDRYASSSKLWRSKITTWIHGITSHMGVLAICVRSEPSDEVTYRTLREESATVVFSVEHPHCQPRFPWHASPSVNESGAYDAILKKLDGNLLNMEVHNGSDLRVVYNTALLTLELFDDGRPQRISLAKGMLDILARRLLLPNAFEEEHHLLSQESKNDEPDATRWCQLLTVFMSSRLPFLVNDPTLNILVDQCPIPSCRQPIALGGSVDGACLEGHTLAARCGITFLPLVEPITMKHCYGCARSFMNEITHPLCQSSDDTNLVQMLARGYKRCPYCRGKFYTKHVAS